MAIRTATASAASSDTGLSEKSIVRAPSNAPPQWVRNPSWPACDAALGSNSAVFLMSVYPGRDPQGSNYFAMRASGGNYTVDFGDGTVTNYLNSADAQIQYSFDSAALVGTDAPVTLDNATDSVLRTSHGYTNGMTVFLYNVTGTPEVSSGQSFYVVNASTDSFQVSFSLGGSPIVFSADGAATLLPYRIAKITVTPQAAQTVTGLDLNRRHSALTNTTDSGLLDMCIAWQTLTTLTMGNSTGFARHTNVQRVRILQLSTASSISFDSLFRDFRALQSVTISITNVSNVAQLFQDCASLTYAPEMALLSCTTMSSMFNNCRSLYSVPSYTAPLCTDMNSMFLNCIGLENVGRLTVSTSSGVGAGSAFNGCGSLRTAPVIVGRLAACSSMFQSCNSLRDVPIFDTSTCSSFGSMFLNCGALEVAPLLNTQGASFMDAMFSGCRALVVVPKYNTPNLTVTSNMFNACVALETIPLFNTQNVTTMNNMFISCVNLKTVPLLNTQSVTNMSGMFQNCVALKTVPLFNTQSVTNMSNMFNQASALVEVPRFNISRNVNLQFMFSSCSSLKVVPQLDTRLCVTVNGMFGGCTALQTIPALDFSAATSMNGMFSGCTSLISVPGLTFGPFSMTVASTMFQSCTSLKTVGPMNFGAVSSATNFNGLFQTCSSLSRAQIFGMRYSFALNSGPMSKGSMEEIFDNLATAATSQFVTVSGNPGVGTVVNSTCGCTAGSTVATTTSTTGITAGMIALGTPAALTTARTATADPGTDTVTLASHGLANGTKVSFSSLGTITGVSLNFVYFVVNATTDTFQVATVAGGSAINLTGTSGSVSIRYPSYVVSINPGVSVTLSAPLASTGSFTISFRTLDVSSALMKNWTVNF
jgi:surface protein